MEWPSTVKVVPLVISPWTCKSSIPPKASFEFWCCCCAWALFLLAIKPPADKSSQLLYELVPPSNICWGVSSTASAGGVLVVIAGGVLVLVSAADTAQAAALRPSNVAHHRLRWFCRILNDFID